MSTFMCLGYASLTDDLKVDATASFQIPQGLFITNIKVKGSSNIDHQTAEYIQYSTTVDATIDKKNDTVTSSGGWRPTQTTTKYTGTVTYEITVYNNTQYEYAYRGLYYQKTEFNNSQVATTANDGKLGVVTAFPEGSIVAPRERTRIKCTATIPTVSSSKRATSFSFLRRTWHATDRLSERRRLLTLTTELIPTISRSL